MRTVGALDWLNWPNINYTAAAISGLTFFGTNYLVKNFLSSQRCENTSFFAYLATPSCYLRRWGFSAGMATGAYMMGSYYFPKKPSIATGTKTPSTTGQLKLELSTSYIEPEIKEVGQVRLPSPYVDPGIAAEGRPTVGALFSDQWPAGTSWQKALRDSAWTAAIVGGSLMTAAQLYILGFHWFRIDRHVMDIREKFKNQPQVPAQYLERIDAREKATKLRAEVEEISDYIQGKYIEVGPEGKVRIVGQQWADLFAKPLAEIANLVYLPYPATQPFTQYGKIRRALRIAESAANDYGYTFKQGDDLKDTEYMPLTPTEHSTLTGAVEEMMTLENQEVDKPATEAYLEGGEPTGRNTKAD